MNKIGAQHVKNSERCGLEREQQAVPAQKFGARKSGNELQRDPDVAARRDRRGRRGCSGSGGAAPAITRVASPMEFDCRRGHERSLLRELCSFLPSRYNNANGVRFPVFLPSTFCPNPYRFGSDLWVGYDGERRTYDAFFAHFRTRPEPVIALFRTKINFVEKNARGNFFRRLLPGLRCQMGDIEEMEADAILISESWGVLVVEVKNTDYLPEKALEQVGRDVQLIRSLCQNAGLNCRPDIQKVVVLPKARWTGSLSPESPGGVFIVTGRDLENLPKLFAQVVSRATRIGDNSANFGSLGPLAAALNSLAVTADRDGLVSRVHVTKLYVLGASGCSAGK